MLERASLSSLSGTRFMQVGKSKCRRPIMSLIAFVMNEWYKNGILMVGMASSSGRQADHDEVNLIKVVHRVITRRQAETDGSKPCHQEQTQRPAIPTRSHNEQDSNSRSELKSVTSFRFAPVDASTWLSLGVSRQTLDHWSS